MESTAIQTAVCTGSFLATHQAGLQWATLEDSAHPSEWRHCCLSDFVSYFSCLLEVFERLWVAGLTLKPSKCAILQPEVKYQENAVGRNGVATDPRKVRAVKEWTVSRNLLELRAFSGLVGSYRQYIPRFAGVAQPLKQ